MITSARRSGGITLLAAALPPSEVLEASAVDFDLRSGLSIDFFVGMEFIQ
jgi:hypothetical protein